MLRFKVPFQVSIVSAILVIVVALSAATLGSVYVASSKTAEETAGQLFAGVARTAQERVDREVGDTLKLAGLGASQPFFGALSEQGLDFPALPLLYAALADDPSIYSVYYGFENANFLQVIATRSDSRILEAHKAPAGTAWIVRSISGSGDARRQVWSFLDASRMEISRQVDQAPSYDPRKRPWYEAAKAAEGAQLSAPYVFNSLQQPGITASRRMVGGAGVFGVDITLSGLDDFVAEQSVSANGGIVLFDDAQRILAYSHGLGDAGQPALAEMKSLNTGIMQALARLAAEGGGERTRVVEDAGGRLLVRMQEWRGGGRSIGIAVAAPIEDFSGGIRDMQKQILLLALGALVAFLPGALFFSARMAATVRALAADAVRVQNFDFSGREAPSSRIIEFSDLGTAFGMMKATLEAKTRALEVEQEKLGRLVDLGIAMSAERDTTKLMEMVLVGAKELTNADGGTLYTIGDDGKLHFQILRNDTLNVALGGTSGNPITIPAVPLFDDEGRPNHRNVVSHAVHEQVTVNIADAYDSTAFDFSGTKAFDARTGYRSTSFMTVPLKPRGGDIIGALQLINARPPGSDKVIPFVAEIQRFVEALAAQAATAMYNRELLSAQERLMDSMIQLIAGAIDAKSPYTGGHCERVPELALMLAREATNQKAGPLADFRFETDEEWREFRIGAWLHDCGKVVTPEYIVDKATKLETIYNRIHEVRMRFEVLLRDAEILRLRAIAEGMDPAQANARMAARKAQLLDDFAFVAECNVGGEFMAPEKVERLQQIASQTWWRHFDERLGLGHEELKRYDHMEDAPLPVAEPLLGDKPHHVIPRLGGMHKAYETLDFKVKVPENLYNMGEVYNLSIGRGTLTEEDRFKINEHIMQTIAMLETMPFPKQLRRVPEYAGTHHETLIGTGYPRKLTKDELSVPSRIMAIADIFEALTASDRPYKKAKTLSECIKILSFFKKDGHIDPDLFDLFLTSGIYKDYAERFLLPEQLDEVDISKYISA
ncbi:HD domain-containing phosphohydrolase [Magnetospirillum sp. UT-4]|uniref:HD domain-containing phosphohydrolase n=1 Tax=Magnetospirillum sp. UT-4 TaxID=2681467 RepID=UPI0013826EA0|nr:HD domain-containing phosphohydrolase [Magnetospirillum sp. UT-4]CAA7613860.1 Methyl-accepting chemotaxis protein [Magnetospirillum sp. UT-4]